MSQIINLDQNNPTPPKDIDNIKKRPGQQQVVTDAQNPQMQHSRIPDNNQKVVQTAGRNAASSNMNNLEQNPDEKDSMAKGGKNQGLLGYLKKQRILSKNKLVHKKEQNSSKPEEEDGMDLEALGQGDDIDLEYPRNMYIEYEVPQGLYSFIIKMLYSKSRDTDLPYLIRATIAVGFMFIAQCVINSSIMIELSSDEDKKKEVPIFIHFARPICMFLLYCIISIEMKKSIDLIVISITTNARKYFLHGVFFGIFRYSVAFFVMQTSAMLIFSATGMMDMVVNFSALVIINEMDNLLADHIELLIGRQINEEYFKFLLLKSQLPQNYGHFSKINNVLLFGPLIFLVIYFILSLFGITLG